MRQEDFKKAAEDYVDGEPDGAQKIIGQVGFEFGAEYGYQYAVDKACEVIARLYPEAAAYYEQPETFVEQIRKAMEE